MTIRATVNPSQAPLEKVNPKHTLAKTKTIKVKRIVMGDDRMFPKKISLFLSSLLQRDIIHAIIIPNKMLMATIKYAPKSFECLNDETSLPSHHVYP